MVGTRFRAGVVLGFALLFYSAFMFAKHSSGLRDVTPFGDDPYDAVGSFGAIIAVLLSVVSAVRAFRAPRGGAQRTEHRRYQLRTQSAVVLCVMITVLGDVVAMVRDPSRWIRSQSRFELVALLMGLVLAAWAVQIMIRTSLGPASPVRTKTWLRALVPVLGSAAILAVYPVQLVQFTVTHLLTVIVGAVLLVAPMPGLLRALVPSGATEESTGNPLASPTRRSARGRWWLVIGIGIAVGAFAFAGEMTEGGGHAPVLRLAAVAAVFIGLATSGALIAYVFLRKPLGLGARTPHEGDPA